MLYEHLICFLLTYKKTDSLELRSRIRMSHFHFFVCFWLVWSNTILIRLKQDFFALFYSLSFYVLFKIQTSSIISDGMLCSCVGGGTVLWFESLPRNTVDIWLGRMVSPAFLSQGYCLCIRSGIWWLSLHFQPSAPLILLKTGFICSPQVARCHMLLISDPMKADQTAGNDRRGKHVLLFNETKPVVYSASDA